MILEAAAALGALFLFGGKKKKKKNPKPNDLASLSKAELAALANSGLPGAKLAANMLAKNLTPLEILTGPLGAGINAPIRIATGGKVDPLGGAEHAVDQVVKLF